MIKVEKINDFTSLTVNFSNYTVQMYTSIGSGSCIKYIYSMYPLVITRITPFFFNISYTEFDQHLTIKTIDSHGSEIIFSSYTYHSLRTIFDLIAKWFNFFDKLPKPLKK